MNQICTACHQPTLWDVCIKTLRVRVRVTNTLTHTFFVYWYDLKLHFMNHCGLNARKKAKRNEPVNEKMEFMWCLIWVPLNIARSYFYDHVLCMRAAKTVSRLRWYTRLLGSSLWLMWLVKYHGLCHIISYDVSVSMSSLIPKTLHITHYSTVRWSF